MSHSTVEYVFVLEADGFSLNNAYFYELVNA
jgi:hypothetical protein